MKNLTATARIKLIVTVSFSSTRAMIYNNFEEAIIFWRLKILKHRRAEIKIGRLPAAETKLNQCTKPRSTFFCFYHRYWSVGRLWPLLSLSLFRNGSARRFPIFGTVSRANRDLSLVLLKVRIGFCFSKMSRVDYDFLDLIVNVIIPNFWKNFAFLNSSLVKYFLLSNRESDHRNSRSKEFLSEISCVIAKLTE